MSLGAIDMTASFDPSADHHAEHEYQADDHRATEEQIEDLATVEADLDLVLVRLGHASTVRFCGPQGNFFAYCMMLMIDSAMVSIRNNLPSVEGRVTSVEM